MRIQTFILTLLLCLLASAAHAEVIREIVVVDNAKTTDDTVLYIANIETGDDWNEEVKASVTVELVSSGLFKKIDIFSEPHPKGGVKVTIIAKDNKEIGINEFIEETFIPRGSATRKTLYVPKTSIRKKDSILIIDDVVRSGETVQALVDLVRNQRADIAGIYVLVTVGDEWREYLGNIISKYSFEVLIEI